MSERVQRIGESSREYQNTYLAITDRMSKKVQKIQCAPVMSYVERSADRTEYSDEVIYRTEYRTYRMLRRCHISDGIQNVQNVQILAYIRRNAERTERSDTDIY